MICVRRLVSDLYRIVSDDFITLSIKTLHCYSMAYYNLLLLFLKMGSKKDTII